MDQPVPCEYVFVAVEEHNMPEDGTETTIVCVCRTAERAQAALDKRGPACERDVPGGGWIDRFIEEHELDNRKVGYA